MSQLFTFHRVNSSETTPHYASVILANFYAISVRVESNGRPVNTQWKRFATPSSFGPYYDGAAHDLNTTLVHNRGLIFASSAHLQRNLPKWLSCHQQVTLVSLAEHSQPNELAIDSLIKG